jgi:uncharacterized protein
MHWLLSGQLSVEKLTVTLPGLTPSLQGTKLVQMSDFHYDGLRLSDEMLEQAIAVSNEAQADIIVLTGDYITDDPKPIHKLVLKLKHLQSRVGIYAVLGNHDNWYRYQSKEEVTNALTGIGIHVLWNEIAYPFGQELPIVGLADYWSREFNPHLVMSQLDPATPRLVLSHNPDTAEVLQVWRVDLQLSGHTHGGQILLPGIGPIAQYYLPIRNRIPKKILPYVPLFKEHSKVIDHWEWAQGFHRVGANQLYVNRGLGTYLPGRLFCPPEVTIITLN